MKKGVIALVILLSATLANAAYTVRNDADWTVTVEVLTCAAYKVQIDYLANDGGYFPGQTLETCSTSYIGTGTTFRLMPSGAVLTVTSVLPICVQGTHFDSSTYTCVDDVTIAVASCMPSIRTISPCPSGYAPTNAIPAGSGAPSPFTSAFDGLPIQDMIYAVGIAICGLLGISVGVKLV